MERTRLQAGQFLAVLFSRHLPVAASSSLLLLVRVSMYTPIITILVGVVDGEMPTVLVRGDGARCVVVVVVVAVVVFL